MCVAPSIALGVSYYTPCASLFLQAEESLSRLAEERSEAASQYEAYIEQLQQHSQTLATQQQTLREERDQHMNATHQLQTQLQAHQQQGTTTTRARRYLFEPFSLGETR